MARRGMVERMSRTMHDAAAKLRDHGPPPEWRLDPYSGPELDAQQSPYAAAPIWAGHTQRLPLVRRIVSSPKHVGHKSQTGKHHTIIIFASSWGEPDLIFAAKYNPVFIRITGDRSKPASGGQVKTGQWGTGQNRPVGDGSKPASRSRTSSCTA
jgi:hypothetical protein